MVLRRPPLLDSVVAEVLKLVADLGEDYPIPSETKLAVKLGVSRPTVREAMRKLEGAGHIVRRRGVGSFIRSGPIEAGIETLQSYLDTISRAGHRARNEVLSIRKARLPDSIVVALGTTDSRIGLHVESLYYADNLPVILSKVYLPLRIVQSVEHLKARQHYSSMHQFLEHHLGIPVRYARRAVAAERPPARVAALLKLRKGDPTLLLEGLTYGDRDVPLLYTRSYFRTDKYRFTLIRKARDLSPLTG